MPTLMLSVIFCLVTGFLARRKGYSFVIWCFAAGGIGLIVLAFLPCAATPRQRSVGNWIGAAIPLSIILLLVVLGVMNRSR